MERPFFMRAFDGDGTSSMARSASCENGPTGSEVSTPVCGPLGMPPTVLADLSDDILEQICLHLLDCISLVRVSRCCDRFHRVATDSEVIIRCAARYDIKPPSTRGRVRLSVLGVAQIVAGLGTNRIFFHRERCGTQKVRPELSMPRVTEIALLLRRIPELTLVIDGHEGRKEGLVVHGSDGTPMRASKGFSEQRAQAVRTALLDLENLKSMDAKGNRVWGMLPKRRFDDRIQCRAWEDAVAEAAAWGDGIESSHAEVYFTIDGVTIPRRGDHYKRAAQAREACVGWQRYFAEE